MAVNWGLAANGGNFLQQLAAGMEDVRRQEMQQLQQQSILQQLTNAQDDRQFRRDEALRNQRNQDRTYGLQVQQLTMREDPEKVRLARAAGLTPGTPQWQQFLTGDQQKLSAGDRKAILDAEDEVPALQGNLEALQRAKAILPHTFTGYSAGVRGVLGTNLPKAVTAPINAVTNGAIDPNAAAATREYDQIMSLEAIKSMSANLKGATTDRELFEFQRILSDPSTPHDIRLRTIDRMEKLVERQLKLKQDRIEQMRGGNYYRPQTQQAPQQTQQFQEGQTATGPGGQKIIFRNGQWMPLQ